MKPILILLLTTLFIALSHVAYGQQADSPGIDKGPAYICGAPEPTAEQMVQAYHRAQQYQKAHPKGLNSPNISIPVAFHVIQDENQNGYVSTSRLQSQISVLNSAFSGTTFSFYMNDVDYTLEDDWYDVKNFSSDDQNMKQALAHQPTYVLNIYIIRPT